ncbi:MAG TPA: hypothetical protein IAA98_09545 [Candidatus Avipropionibacterium avicola]|uniref:Uncharacterized protein n=1 Tax=Candidatus Avipropionibacterium avicola TaxID=2840701 RepID=A0A9D1GZ56_9ACTN|nr:hypothetical protein [Candidatus Avipropionibacterium avicola]
MSRPRVALIATAWFRDSHADVLAGPLVRGYPWNGEHQPSRIEIVSAHIEQHGVLGPEGQELDVGLPILAEAGIPQYETPAEALGAGRPGVNVDGVLIIGEHGRYEENEWGQQVYPRRRLFDACISAMIATDTFIPIANDKHLAWNWTDAKAMYDTAASLGVPLLAGSTIPLSWRRPRGTAWPYGAQLDAIVGAAYGPFERYGYHCLEGVQAFAERRAGGETGVAEVHGWAGAEAADGVATIDSALLERAIAAHGVAPDDIGAAIDRIEHVITATHRDGLRSAVVLSPALRSFSVAATGPDHEVDAELHLQPGRPHSHFAFLARAVESLMLERRPPYPVERTLLTGGILDHAMKSAHGAVEPATPHLDVTYEVEADIPATGVPLDPYELADH